MLKQIWHLLIKVALVLGVLLSFFFTAEVLRVYALFYRYQPWLAYTFAACVVTVVAIALFEFIRRVVAQPRALRPPPLPADLAQAGHDDLRRYCRYLVRGLNRLADNPNLDDEHRRALVEQAEEVRGVLGAHPLNDDLARAIRQSEEEIIAPALEQLNGEAGVEVRRCVRDVMLGVMLSPYASADLIIVLYRNLAMVSRLVGIYRTRPGIQEQFLILRDIARVVATVNFLNISRKLIESLFSQIPMIGRALDDVGQGLGAGLLTSAAGHAAMERCGAYRRWNREVAAETLRGQMAGFLGDVRDMLTKDLVADLKGRIRSSVPPETTESPGFWDNVLSGLSTAVEMTTRVVDSYVVRPAVAGVRGIAGAGAQVTRGVVSAGSAAARASVRHGRHASRGLARVVRTFAQRVRYTLRGGRMTL